MDVKHGEQKQPAARTGGIYKGGRCVFLHIWYIPVHRYCCFGIYQCYTTHTPNQGAKTSWQTFTAKTATKANKSWRHCWLKCQSAHTGHMKAATHQQATNSAIRLAGSTHKPACAFMASMKTRGTSRLQQKAKSCTHPTPSADPVRSKTQHQSSHSSRRHWLQARRWRWAAPPAQTRHVCLRRWPLVGRRACLCFVRSALVALVRGVARLWLVCV